ncbi:putative ribosomal protein L30/YlxQ [Helianthus debilis subsp. tardiflorus]
MVSVKKTKKTHESINNRLAPFMKMKSGKYTLGYKTVLESLRTQKVSKNRLNFQLKL